MRKTLTHRFMIMLESQEELTRAELTRRALGQIRQLNMVKLKIMISKLKRQGLIQSRSKQVKGKPGPIPQYISLTEAGKEWLEDENEKGDK